MIRFAEKGRRDIQIPEVGALSRLHPAQLVGAAERTDALH